MKSSRQNWRRVTSSQSCCYQPDGGLTRCQSLKVEDGGKGHTSEWPGCRQCKCSSDEDLSFKSSKCHGFGKQMKTKGKRPDGTLFTNADPRYAGRLDDLQGGDNRSWCPLCYKPCEHRKIESSFILSCGVHKAYSQVDISYDYHNEDSGFGFQLYMEHPSGGVRLWVGIQK